MKEKATFAAGCFWHVEAAFRRVKGVISATSGYTGGSTEKPSYEDVCSDKTGHAEAVLVEFDPTQITYSNLLKTFWRVHDPTQLNRQGNDVGSQYRSVIYYHNDAQEKAAIDAVKKEQEKHGKPVATKIVKASKFWPAEEYHQNYFGKHGKVCGI
ncbi:MAG TPA: peptide-methionine (S)-S-oxide reductase MsrA [archaeon]|nr:peptide-methionine (S)-S-oxide reductase MsrA [archaeon]